MRSHNEERSGKWKTVRSVEGSGQRLIILELRVVIKKKVGSSGDSRKNAESIFKKASF